MLIGPAVGKGRDEPRQGHIVMGVNAKDRLRTLLHEPEMHGVGYTEFIHRACEAAETEIAERRRSKREAS